MGAMADIDPKPATQYSGRGQNCTFNPSWTCREVPTSTPDTAVPTRIPAVVHFLIGLTFPVGFWVARRDGPCRTKSAGLNWSDHCLRAAGGSWQTTTDPRAAARPLRRSETMMRRVALLAAVAALLLYLGGRPSPQASGPDRSMGSSLLDPDAE